MPGPLHECRQAAVVDHGVLDGLEAAQIAQHARLDHEASAGGARGAITRVVNPGERVNELEKKYEWRREQTLPEAFGPELRHDRHDCAAFVARLIPERRNHAGREHDLGVEQQAIAARHRIETLLQRPELAAPALG